MCSLSLLPVWQRRAVLLAPILAVGSSGVHAQDQGSIGGQPPAVQAQGNSSDAGGNAGFGISAPAPERATRVTPSIDARVVFTNNSGTNHEPDQVVEVQPAISVVHSGPRVTLSGTAAVSSLNYVQKTQTSRVLPRARMDLQSKLIDELVFLDAWARVDPTFDDPYAARPEASTTYKMESRTRYGISPYVMKEFADAGSLLLRTDYMVARATDFQTKNKATSTALDHTVSFERKARPLGFSVEGKTHSETNDQPLDPALFPTAINKRVLKTQEARVWMSYAVAPQIELGVVVGGEKTSLMDVSHTDTLYGGRVKMRPSQRTDMQLTVEQRYFGTGVQASLDHRSRALSFSSQIGRTVSSGSMSDVAQPVIGPPSGDAPVGSADPLLIFSTVAQLRESAGVQIGLQGRRNQIFAQAGYLKQRALQLPGQTFPAIDAYDTEQNTAGLGWSLRITPITTASLMFDWTRIKNLGHGLSGALARAPGEFTTQQAIRAEIVRNLTLNSTLTVGLRHLSVNSNFLTSNDVVGESAAYVGIRHRF